MVELEIELVSEKLIAEKKTIETKSSIIEFLKISFNLNFKSSANIRAKHNNEANELLKNKNTKFNVMEKPMSTLYLVCLYMYKLRGKSSICI